MERFVIVPDEKLEPLMLLLKAKLPNIAAEIRAEHLADLIDRVARRVLRGAAERPGVDEIVVWGVSGNGFLAAWSSLAPETEVVGVVTASAEEGLIARVFASSRSEAQAAPGLGAAHWTNLEQRRGRMIAGMAATPLLLFGKPVAVLSLVTYDKEGAAEPGSFPGTVPATEAAGLLVRLIEDRLVRSSLGLEP